MQDFKTKLEKVYVFSKEYEDFESDIENIVDDVEIMCKRIGGSIYWERFDSENDLAIMDELCVIESTDIPSSMGCKRVRTGELKKIFTEFVKWAARIPRDIDAFTYVVKLSVECELFGPTSIRIERENEDYSSMVFMRDLDAEKIAEDFCRGNAQKDEVK